MICFEVLPGGLKGGLVSVDEVMSPRPRIIAEGCLLIWLLTGLRGGQVSRFEMPQQ